MKSRFEYEVETLRVSLQASVDALKEIDRSPSGLTRYGKGLRDAYEEVIGRLDRILEGGEYMSTWLHYYNARRPDRPAAGSVSIENRYGAYYYISMGAYKRAMMKLRQRDGEVEIAFRGPERFIGEKIAVITYSFVGIEGKMIPELQIIGSVEGVY